MVFIGAHPGFNCLLIKMKVDDYSLIFEHNELLIGFA